MLRRKSRAVKVRNLIIGGDAPVSVQTMSTISPADSEAALADAQRLALCGAELIRFAVPDMKAAKGLAAVVKGSPVPLVADIHFDHMLALQAVASGVDALRINPGNIGSEDKVAAVVAAVKRRISLSVSASTAALCRQIYWRHMRGIRRRREWLKARCGISVYANGLTAGISLCP